MAPRFSRLIIDAAKLQDYCLSESHPRGRHKARVFRSRLGLVATHAPVLREALDRAVRGRADEMRETVVDDHGRRYVLDFSMTTERGTAIIRPVWILRTGQDVLSLITCYVL